MDGRPDEPRPGRGRGAARARGDAEDDDGREKGRRAARARRRRGTPASPPGKRLVLKRIVTRQYPDGRVEKIEDDVSADVGEAWMRARRVGADGTIDLEKSREAVMQILYPHGVDPPAYVSGGSIDGGGLSLNAGTGQAQLERDARAPRPRTSRGTADPGAELLRLRAWDGDVPAAQEKPPAPWERRQASPGKRTSALEEGRPRRRRAQQGPGGGGGEGQGPGADPAPKKLKIALSFKPKHQAGSARPSRFKPERGFDPGRARGLRAAAGQTPADARRRSYWTSRRPWPKDPNFASFIAPVTKMLGLRELPSPRKMDLGTVKTLRAPGGYPRRGAWMADACGRF